MTMSSAAEIAYGPRFLGSRRDYWRLLSRGAALLLLTLGIYRFWLMTDVRRFLWCHTEIDGETLEYLGTPFELLLGFLIALTVLIPIYGGFFLAALELGPVGEWSGLIGFLGLAFLGQYALYRARRYRLSRTVYRGLRFSQTGSAWLYAIRALLWWGLTIVTLGLAYPFQVARLERYKMRNTFYGMLPGQFDASGWRLFLRGLPLWLLTVGPLVLAIGSFAAVDWDALTKVVGQGGEDIMGRVEGVSPGLGAAIAFALLMVALSALMAALLYPVFQTLVLRWWLSGLRFGALTVRSKLRIRDVYRAYVRFLSHAIVFTIVLTVASVLVALALGAISNKLPDVAEVAGAALALGGYVIAALGFSTIYRATVLLGFWQLGVESVQLSGVETLDSVEASVRSGSPFSEGLADALNVGGY
jgi:uncharacterized membrane protein YjgN (DUF898 family)